MSDHNCGGVAIPWRLSTTKVVLVSMMMAPLGILLIAPVLGESGQAAVTVGLVLAEAMTLYVGYGALTRVSSPLVRELLVSD